MIPGGRCVAFFETERYSKLFLEFFGWISGTCVYSNNWFYRLTAQIPRLLCAFCEPGNTSGRRYSTNSNSGKPSSIMPFNDDGISVLRHYTLCVLGDGFTAPRGVATHQPLCSTVRSNTSSWRNRKLLL
jgi:hypothetical protein